MDGIIKWKGTILDGAVSLAPVTYLPYRTYTPRLRSAPYANVSRSRILTASKRAKPLEDNQPASLTKVLNF